jgi:predicted RNase H-like HicB family nuclease
VPDLPACITIGASIEEIEHNIREATELNPEGVREDGLPGPVPSTIVEYCGLVA